MFIFLILYNMFAIFMKKRISYFEIYITSFFAIAFGRTVDAIFDVMYKLYWFLDKEPDWPGLFAQFLIYPSTNAIFLNFFPFKKRMTSKFLYIFAWTVFSLLIELLSLKTGFFTYNGWKMWYSAAFYPLTFLVLFLNLKITRKLFKTEQLFSKNKD
ncbi:CBO0543 family protein [Bacillus sp. SORGH_AS_0510]|uniref:CBO0543 family protein n=1 Tax=Bacillus sp. SORGH_AS_0510 TaxID=3041771 RepID=UPI0027D81809|nr:CBO0543 family protein [Bacillus sp. SORGH_AS_0510]